MTWGSQIFVLGSASLAGLFWKVLYDCDFDSEKLDMLPWNISPQYLWMIQFWGKLSFSCMILGATMSAAGY